MRYWKPKPIQGEPHVTIVVASYMNEERRNRLPMLRCLLYSLLSQTYTKWNAVVVHDGPLDAEIQAAVTRDLPDKISLVTTPRKIGHFGHKYRRRYALEGPNDVVGFTNDDNYYAPTYLEWCLSIMTTQKIPFVYCDMIHSHKLWKPLNTLPQRGRLDLGGFLVRRSLVEATPWDDFSFSGDGKYINALVARAKKTAKVAATLFVHN